MTNYQLNPKFTCIQLLRVLFSLSILTMTDAFPVESPAKPVSVNEYLVRAEATIRPWVVVDTPGGDIVVGGVSSATKQGYAMKMDRKGKEIWRYRRDLLEEDKPALALIYIAPEIHGAIGMPDGSTYLCGTQMRPLGKQSLGLVVHLDPSGKVIREWLLAPEGHSDKGLPHIYRCGQWKGDLIFVGSVGRSYWILSVDTNGVKKWETILPASPNGVNPSVAFEGLVLFPRDRDLVFSATDNVSTELVRLDEGGRALAQKMWHGRFLVCQSVSGSDELQIYGSPGSASDSSRRSIYLDDNLSETKRIDSLSLSPFVASGVFRLADRSLVLFGSSVHELVAPRLRAAISHVDEAIGREESLEVETHGMFDSGVIPAFAPIGRTREFAIVRSLVVSHGDGDYIGDGGPFNRGAVVNFIRVAQ